MKKLLNLPAILLISHLIHTLMTQASIGDALIMMALSALYAGNEWLNLRRQEPINKETLERIIALEEQLGATRDKVNAVTLGVSTLRTSGIRR